jgi:hypothetical protein
MGSDLRSGGYRVEGKALASLLLLVGACGGRVADEGGSTELDGGPSRGSFDAGAFSDGAATPSDAAPNDARSSPSADSGAPVSTDGSSLDHEDGSGPASADDAGESDGGEPSSADSSAPPTDGPADDGSLSDAGFTVLASDQSAWQLAVDAQNLYWTQSSSAGSIMQMPKGGGPAIAIASDQYYGFGIEVDAEYVYFSDSLGAIKRVPIGGGTVTTLATLQSNVEYWLAVNATTLFVAGDEIASIPKGGGEVTLLASTQYDTYGMTIDDANIYWTAESNGGSVNAMPLGGGTVTVLASNLVDPVGCAVGGSSVFFALISEGELQSVPIAGGTITTLVQSAPAPIPALYDLGNLYWSTSEPTGSIFASNVASGETRPIAGSFFYPGNIVVDATNAYWTVEGGGGMGGVMTAPK